MAFFEEEWDVLFGILGHAGFLDRYVVSFNYPDNYFVVETPDDWDARMPPLEDAIREYEERQPLDWERPRLD